MNTAQRKSSQEPSRSLQRDRFHCPLEWATSKTTFQENP